MDDGGTSREVRALRSLHDLITAVHSVQDLEAVLQTIAQGVVHVLGFEVAVIDCVDDDGYVEAVAVAGDEDACRTLKGRRLPLSEMLREFTVAEEWGLLRFVPHDRLPADAVTSWVPNVEPLDVPDAWHPLDALYAPLHGPTGHLLGVLSVDLPVDRRRPSRLGRQVLEMYAVQAGLAIHQAQEQARLRERVRLASATRTIVETASRELDLHRVVDGTFQPLVDGFRCDHLLIRVFDSVEEDIGTEGLAGAGATYPEDLLERAMARFASEPGVQDLSTTRLLQMGERVARTCWPARNLVARVDAPVELLDEQETSEMRAFLGLLDSASLMIVPLGTGPECLGYITMVRRDTAARWTPAEDDAALEVGREIGRAVHRARLYQRERELVTRLQELDRYKSEMIATITHELKNPLTSIVGYLELLGGPDSNRDGHSLAAIARNVARLSSLVDDMLVLAMVSDPHRPFRPSEVDLGVLVRDVCDAMAVQVTRGGLTLDLTDVDTGVAVVAEREDLVRLVENIVGNALKYTDAGGLVTVAVREQDGFGVFSCADTGLGIRTEDVGGLFEEFDRSSNPLAHTVPGSGLGLAIVRRIAERHAAAVDVRSELGRGSSFRVALPLVSATSRADAEAEPIGVGELHPR